MAKKYYSFVFRPSVEVVSTIADMRSKLGYSGKIGAGASDIGVNIIEFEAEQSELVYFQEYVSSFTAAIQPGDVEFTTLDAFSPSPGRDNGVLYFAPSRKSQPFFQAIMNDFSLRFPMKDQIWAYHSAKPYISVASGLSKNRLLAARQFFSGIKSLKLAFRCDNITLMEFHPEQNRFVELESFVFGGVLADSDRD